MSLLSLPGRFVLNVTHQNYFFLLLRRSDSMYLFIYVVVWRIRNKHWRDFPLRLPDPGGERVAPFGNCFTYVFCGRGSSLLRSGDVSAAAALLTVNTLHISNHLLSRLLFFVRTHPLICSTWPWPVWSLSSPPPRLDSHVGVTLSGFEMSNQLLLSLLARLLSALVQAKGLSANSRGTFWEAACAASR